MRKNAYYIESGIPIIAALENDQIGHAILVIGHENDGRINFRSAVKSNIDYNGRIKRFIDYSDLPKRFIVNDDNLTPYRVKLLLLLCRCIKKSI
jgi:hypothetical protein